MPRTPKLGKQLNGGYEYWGAIVKGKRLRFGSVGEVSRSEANEAFMAAMDAAGYAVRKKSKDQKPKITNLYLMRHTNGLTKIGVSKSPYARERTLQAEDPRLEMIFCCRAYVATESRLHKIFKSVRIRGEWFDLQPRHVDWIKAVLSSMDEKILL